MKVLLMTGYRIIDPHIYIYVCVCVCVCVCVYEYIYIYIYIYIKIKEDKIEITEVHKKFSILQRQSRSKSWNIQIINFFSLLFKASYGSYKH